jgi:hypothetical protein
VTLLDLRQAARAAMPELPDLPGLRLSAIETWRGRMKNEHASSHVFLALAEQAGKLERLPAEVTAELGEFAAEERRHGELCGAVVEALGAEARAEVGVPRAVPRHADVPALEGFLRNTLSVCCLSETVAVALIGAERLQMSEGPLRDLLTRIWSDEVGHARFGWRWAGALVPELDGAARDRLGLYLRVALRHLELHELLQLPRDSQPPPEGAALGLCSGADSQQLFYETVEQVILPRLEQLGLDAERAWSERTRADALLR